MNLERVVWYCYFTCAILQVT